MKKSKLKAIFSIVAVMSDRFQHGSRICQEPFSQHMYTIYNGSSWSQPQKVSDNLTADFEPSICSDGNGGVHILWQDATEVFSEGITLEGMAAKVDLSYIHWNGSSFEEKVSITNNNQDLEMNHKIVSYGDNISVVWKENSDNDVFGLTGTNSICRKKFVSGSWSEVELVKSGLSVVPTIDTSYSNGENVIAYVAKSGTDTTTISDLEIYYIDNSQTTRLTNNNIADYSVCFCDDSLYWIRNNSAIKDLNQPELFFPRNLYDAHERICKQNLNKMISYENVVDTYKSLEFSDGELCIILPRSASDLITEGEVLRHCVGSYVNRQKEGKSIIFFVRKHRRRERSYYTLNIDFSYREPKEIQLHGYGNERHGEKKQYKHSIPKKVRDFVDRWEREVLKPWSIERFRRQVNEILTDTQKSA